jgi:hypothetical protein
MRKITLIFFCFITFIPTYAQFHEFKGGFLFNSNVSLFHGGGTYGLLDSKRFFASSTGIYVKRNFYKNLYGTFELRYSQKGNSNKLNRDGVVSVRLNYLETPLLFGYSLNTKKNKVYFELGLALGQLINSNIDYGNMIEFAKVIDDFNRNELCLVFSTKTHLRSKENIHIGFRISYSEFFYSIHNYYYLANLVYGLEINYLIN